MPERALIINAATKQPMDDMGLQALNGINQKLLKVKAHSEEEAVEHAQDQYISSPPPDYRVDSVEFEANEVKR